MTDTLSLVEILRENALNPTTSQAATRAAIVAAVRAFCKRVEERAEAVISDTDGDVKWFDAHHHAIAAELAALERTVAADGEAPGVGRSAGEMADLEDGRY